MSVIKVRCTDQVLKITEAPVVASGGKNEVKVEFDFCEKWDGYTKTGVFYRDINDPYYAILDSNDVCVVPWEVCYEDGTFYFTVFGDKGDIRRTSTTVKYKVKKGVIMEDLKPSDPTPDVYSQIMAKLGTIPGTLTVTCVTEEEASHTANEIREYAKKGWNVRFVVGSRELMLDRFDVGIATFVCTDTVTTEDGIALQHEKYYITNSKLIGKYSEVFPQSVGIEVDSNLVEEGKAADAKAVGDKIRAVEDIMQSGYHELEDALLALTDHVEDLHYKPIDITSCSVSPSVAELGATVQTVTVSWGINKTPVSQSLDGESVDTALRSKQLTGLSVTSDRSFAVKAVDERDAEDTANAWIRFCNGVYSGVLTDGAMVNSAAILGLTRALQSGKAKTFTVTAGAAQRIAYALPRRYGTPAFNVGGFDGGFHLSAAFDFTNASGYTEEYCVWLSDNLGLGQTTVKVT